MYIRICSGCNNEVKHKNEKNCRIADKNKKLCPSCRAKKGHAAEKIYVRKCIQCEGDILYSDEKNYLNSLNKTCMSCSVNNANKKPKHFHRECPWCSKKIYYSEEEQRDQATKNNKPCNECRNKEISSRPGVNERRSKAVSGEKNPMYGRSVQQVWSEKYSEEEAELREKQWLDSLSLASSGEKNPMYGQPPPKGSGNGWSGYYKNTHFRSLNELFYLKYLIDNNIEFDNGEKKKYRVKYEFNGRKRSYGMDFYLLESDEYIEIKPKKLTKSPTNSAKFEAARKAYGNKFKVLTEDDLKVIDVDTMYRMYIDKTLVFDKGYEEKFLDYYKKVKNID